MAPDSRAATRAPLAQPWLHESAHLARVLSVDPEWGLDVAEVASRRAVYGPNELAARPPVPAWRKLLAQFRDPLIYLLGAAVAVSFAAWVVEGADGVPFDVIVITSIVLANGAVGYFQEARAEQAVASLQRMAAPLASVLRSGSVSSIAAAEVVPGDVLLLDEGDAIAAAGLLFEAASLRMAEAALTGESEAVLKQPGALAGAVALADRVNMVFAGTSGATGRGRAIVTATGMASEIGGIARLLEQTPDEPTPLQREVRLIGRFLA